MVLFMISSKNIFKTVFLLLSVIFSLTAHASLIINNTRVIYNEQDGESVIKLENNNKKDNPILVQVWIDNGDPDSNPSTISVPFTITPAIFRIDGQKSQSIRILRISDNLPSDRESVFWINFLDVPQKSDNGDQNLMQLSIRNRLKFFYRPKNLPTSVSDAYKLVKFSLTQNASSYKIIIDNPTPYHITIANLDVKSIDGKITHASMNSKNDFMVSPFGKKELVLKKKIPSSNEVRIHYSFVNDFGSESK